MTKQIGRAYRGNRRRSWLLAIAVVVIVAVAIPLTSALAGSGAQKYYTLGFDANGATAAKSICVGDTVDVTMRLSNVAKSQTLGSARVIFPSFVTAQETPSTTQGSITRSGNEVVVQGMDLSAKTGYATFTVTLRADSAGTLTFSDGGSGTVTVKQANQFNDSSGDANLFEVKPGTSLPTLTAEVCTGTISGTIWQDTDENGAPGPTASEPRQPFNVFLYAKSGSTYSVPRTTQAAADGTYTFPNVPLNKTYLVCESDNNPGSPPRVWAQTTPTATQQKCKTDGRESSGWEFLFTASVSDKHFGNVPAVDAQCTSPFQGGVEGNFEYKAKLYTVGGNCKVGELVMLTYTSQQNALVATLHPTSATTGTTFPVIEWIKWTGLPGSQNPVTLRYDDVAPYGDVTREMPMCLYDPRPKPITDPFGLTEVDEATNPIFPAADPAHTSCMIVSTDSAGGTYEAYVYSKVDGYRSTG